MKKKITIFSILLFIFITAGYSLPSTTENTLGNTQILVSVDSRGICDEPCDGTCTCECPCDGCCDGTCNCECACDGCCDGTCSCECACDGCCDGTCNCECACDGCCDGTCSCECGCHSDGDCTCEEPCDGTCDDPKNQWIDEDNPDQNTPDFSLETIVKEVVTTSTLGNETISLFFSLIPIVALVYKKRK